MKMSFPILRVIVGYMGGSYASTVDESISAVRHGTNGALWHNIVFERCRCAA